MMEFTVEGRQVAVLPAKEPDKPVVYLNTFANAINSVYKNLQALRCPDFSLVAISKLKWDHDMTPWYMGPISKHDTPCTGGADDYIKLMLEEIIPKAEQEIPGTPAWRGIAGYSLGGLFAVYSIYQTDIFSRVASMSGSLWFDGIKEFIFSHEMMRRPDCMYFSLGDKESAAKNSILQTVQHNTEEIEAFYRAKGINTTFILNSGNHYQACNPRTAAGIAWILNQ